MDEHLTPEENESDKIEDSTDATSEKVVDAVKSDDAEVSVDVDTSISEDVEDKATEEVIEEVEDNIESEVEEEVENTPSDDNENISPAAEVETSENVEVEGEAEVTEPVLSVADVVSSDETEGTEEGEDVAPVEVEKKKSNNKWYSLRVISGKEKKIKERIELEIQRNKWESSITQVLVPTEKVYKIRAGKKVILERNILPGYILVEAVAGKFRGEMVTAIANIPNVIHFLGRNHPIPMHQSEANRMLGKVDESQDMSAAMIEPFIIGETIKIIDGPFNDFVGDIKEVNEERKKMKVIVKIFGRGTEVELNFMQVEKQS